MKKKVTINYFLNDELNPVVYYDRDSNKLELYPLYIRIIYNRKTTRFRFYPNVHIEKNSDIHVFFRERNIAFLLEDKKRLIEKLIRYESELLNEKFTLKGLGDRLKFYE